MRYLFIFFISFPLWATDVQLTIESAQNLAAKKNRREAAELLRKSIDGNAKSRAKLLEALHVIAKVFFTDKGQKAFEAGQATMFENQEVALTHFRQALDIEDENVLVLANMAKVFMIKQDCESAEQMVSRARRMDPFFAEAAVLELRVLSCLKKAEIFREKMKSLPPLDKWEGDFVQYLYAQDMIAQGLFKKAQDTLQRVTEANPQFPEAYYYLVKSGQEIKKDVEFWQQKYVSLCKAITVRDRKRFGLEPRLCVFMKEVEDELAKSSSDL